MPPETPSSLDKAILLLQALQRRGGSTSLGHLAEAVQVPKPTAHRLLQQLATHDLVESDGDGRYQLGVGLVRLGLGALSGSPVAYVARGALERAAGALGETFFLVTARAGRLWIVERAEGHAMLRAVPTLGAEVPVTSTASGRLYVALAPHELAALPSPTPRGFRAQVQRAAAQGFDVNDGEWIEGLFVVAAPVRVGAALLGCVACAGARQSLAGAARERAIAETRQLAQEIAAQLGAGPDATALENVAERKTR